jgi:hypothetical protein
VVLFAAMHMSLSGLCCKKVTSVMGVSLYESAIASYFGFSRKIRRPATCDFCNTIGTSAT